MRRPGSLKAVEAFSDANVPPQLVRPARKRPAPFSLRLSEDERARLEAAAGSLSPGAYIKGRLFDGLPPVPRQSGASKVDRALLSKLLGGLGQSRLASNMNQIARAANIGTLPVTPELEADLKEACAHIAYMRRTLMQALGLRP